MMSKIFGFFLIIFCFSGSLQAVVAPCQNGQIRSREKAFEESSAIFVGRILQLKEVALKGLRYEEILLEVDPAKDYRGQVFKGEAYLGKLQKTATMVMPLETEDRQVLRVGSTYLFHAVEDLQIERLFTSLCWRNSFLQDGEPQPDREWLIQMTQTEPEEILLPEESVTEEDLSNKE